MTWFRSNIRHASRLALFALAVQFVLSFGHYHALATQVSAVIEGVADSSSPQPDPDSGLSHGSCAICATLALAKTALFATAPHLLLPQAGEFFYLTTDAAFADVDGATAAFQPRAPPAF